MRLCLRCGSQHVYFVTFAACLNLSVLHLQTRLKVNYDFSRWKRSLKSQVLWKTCLMHVMFRKY